MVYPKKAPKPMIMLNVSKPAAYAILAFSIVCEIIGSTCLEACDGFENKKLTVLLILCYFVAFSLFSKILHIIDLAVGYATWGAVGTIATPIVGYFVYKQKLTKTGIFALSLIIVSIVTLNLFGW